MVRLYLMTIKGKVVLESLIQNGFINLIESVVIGTDKNVQNDYHDEIAKLCKQNNINSYNRTEEPVSTNNIIKLAIGWRWLINNETSDNKLIVIHDSLLPRYRGFAPLVSQLINGDTEIGGSMLYATESYDQGAILFQDKTTITYPIKISEAIDQMSLIYKNLSLRLFTALQNGEVAAANAQDETIATYSLWRDEEDYRINWHDSADKILRFIDATGYPYNGATTSLNTVEIIIEDAAVVKDVRIENRQQHIGKVIFINNTMPVVICGEGLLAISKARYTKTNEAVLPLTKFRSRFK